MDTYSVVGQSVPKVDALGKVRGEAVYCADLKMPGMLFGKVKRSPHPFAKILSIDTHEAEKLVGVKAVVTAQNVSQFPYSFPVADELPLCTEYARYVGDEVAGVAAVDEETAEEALDLIKVEYEELSPVFDPEKAMEPGAPALHPENEAIKQNIAYHIDFVRGDGGAGLKQADVVLEDRFSTQIQHQAYLEPQVCLAYWDTSGKLTIWAPYQMPFPSRSMTARALGILEHQVRIIQTCVGGGFGGKAAPRRFVFISAFLSKNTGRPVRIVLNRDEDFMTTRPRVPEVIDLRMGFKKNGTVVAQDGVITADAGAYAGITPMIVADSAVRTGSLYRMPNIKMMVNLVYTNKVATGACRGFGNPQMHFAVESMMDMAAEELGIDPMEIRLKNSTQKGDITVHGWVINSCGLSESIKLAAAKSDWQEKRRKRSRNHGIGMACMIHGASNRNLNPHFDGSAAIVRIDHLGKLKVMSGEVDLGQGALTVFAQIVAEELSIPLGDIEVLPVDTDYSPFGTGSIASRVTVLGGNAVRMAAKDAREQLLRYAAEILGANAEDVAIQDGKVYIKVTPEQKITIGEAALYGILKKRGGAPITGIGAYVVPDSVVSPDRKTQYGNLCIGYSFGTQVAEVSVDPETGKVDVVNFWFAFDVGKVINPMMAEGQVEGAVAQGIGYALTEEYVWKNGRVLNPSLHDYKIPAWVNIPKIYTFFIETENPGSPYGAKGLGEDALVPTAPAIVNAIHNAVGVRIKDLPATPEKILAALRKKDRP